MTTGLANEGSPMKATVFAFVLFAACTASKDVGNFQQDVPDGAAGGVGGSDVAGDGGGVAAVLGGTGDGGIGAGGSGGHTDGAVESMSTCAAMDESCTRGAWTIATADSAGDVGSYASLAVDATGGVHVSYYDGEKGDLKYAY